MAAMVPVAGAHYTEPSEGKVLLFADQRGMLRVDRGLLEQINSGTISFEDAAKQKRAKLFEGCFQDSTRYSEICREFEAKGIGIFNHDIQLETDPEEPQWTSTEEEN